MTEPSLDEVFNDLVPGRRPLKPPPPQRTTQREQPDPVTDWDRNPRRYRLDGVEQDFYPISALARALNRKVPTVRSWEVKGWLPSPRVRGPRIDGVLGHRLYSRRFIEGAQTIAEELGLLDPGVDVAGTGFAARCSALMDKCGG